MALPSFVSTSAISKSQFCETRSHAVIKTKIAVLQIPIVLCHPLRQDPPFIIFCVLTFIVFTSFDNIISFPNSFVVSSGTQPYTLAN